MTVALGTEFDLTLIVSGTRRADGPVHAHAIESMLWFTFNQYQMLYGVEQPRVRLVEGEAQGVDLMCRGIAQKWGWRPEPVAANWTLCGTGCPAGPHRKTGRGGKEYCPYAGHRRNQEMLDRFGAQAMLLLAFPARGPRELSSGTWNMIEKAAAFGLNVMVHSLVLEPAQQQLW